MSTSGQELEVKFYLADLPGLQARLEGLGARLAQARVHEVNLRFDTPANELLNTGRLLRLRQDSAAPSPTKALAACRAAPACARSWSSP